MRSPGRQPMVHRHRGQLGGRPRGARRGDLPAVHGAHPHVLSCTAGCGLAAALTLPPTRATPSRSCTPSGASTASAGRRSRWCVPASGAGRAARVPASGAAAARPGCRAAAPGVLRRHPRCRGGTRGAAAAPRLPGGGSSGAGRRPLGCPSATPCAAGVPRRHPKLARLPAREEIADEEIATEIRSTSRFEIRPSGLRYARDTLVHGPREPLDSGKLQQPGRRGTTRFFGTEPRVPMEWAASAIKPGRRSLHRTSMDRRRAQSG